MGLITVLLAFLALMGTPLFIVIAFSGLFFLYINGIDLTAMIIELYKLAHTPMLVAFPFFPWPGISWPKARPPIVWSAFPMPSWAGCPGDWRSLPCAFPPYLRP